MTDDARAAADLAERKEELRVGARALTRRLKDMESVAADLRVQLKPGISLADRWKILNDLETLNEDVRAARWALYELTANAISIDYNAADVALWCERALEMGAGHPRLDQALLIELVEVRKVPNYPFRAALDRLLNLPTDLVGSENTLRSRVVLDTHRALLKIEEDRGESHGAASLVEKGVPQTRILNRWLGIETFPNPAPRAPGLRLFVSYEQAEALARALNLTPHAAGI